MEYKHKLFFTYVLGIGSARDDTGEQFEGVDMIKDYAKSVSGIAERLELLEDEDTILTGSQENFYFHFVLRTNGDLYEKLKKLMNATGTPPRFNPNESYRTSLTICEKVLKESGKTMYDNKDSPRKCIIDFPLFAAREDDGIVRYLGDKKNNSCILTEISPLSRR